MKTQIVKYEIRDKSIRVLMDEEKRTFRLEIWDGISDWSGEGEEPLNNR